MGVNSHKGPVFAKSLQKIRIFLNTLHKSITNQIHLAGQIHLHPEKCFSSLYRSDRFAGSLHLTRGFEARTNKPISSAYKPVSCISIY